MRFLIERNEIGFVIIGMAKKSRFSSREDRPPKTGHGRPNLGVDNMHYSREILLAPSVFDFFVGFAHDAVTHMGRFSFFRPRSS